MQLDLGNHPIQRLAEILAEAERAHAVYQRSLGHADADWPAWYARHIVDRLSEDESSRSE
ncbi:MAG: hypothetical protein WB615_14260 [Candidatus Tumulicola sp.]